ncbi:MAG TPA: glycosyltransferase [Streptosporangiaceae bacterium]
MSRFLFVVPPLAGHVNPATGLAHAVTQRGHEVAWACAEGFIRPFVGPEALVFRTGMRLYRPQAHHGLAALKSLWAEFVVPFTRFTLPALEYAVASWRPDVIVVDQHAPAGAIVAWRHGLPWASLAVTTMELGSPFAVLPKVDAWIRDQCAAICAEAGLPADGTFDPRFSPHLVLACTTQALAGTAPFPPQYVLAGPMLDGRRHRSDFPWEWLDPRRQHVAVTMGTLATDITQAFHRTAAQALEPLADRLQAIVVAPRGALPDPPPHILVVPRVPLLALMPQLNAVVCHGGLNTVSEALTHGVPLVIAPIRHDQPVNAARVVAAGAGLRLRFARVRAQQMRDAVTTVLDDPSYRKAAGQVRDAFAAAGGAATAAEHLETLAQAAAGAA